MGVGSGGAVSDVTEVTSLVASCSDALVFGQDTEVKSPPNNVMMSLLRDIGMSHLGEGYLPIGQLAGGGEEATKLGDPPPATGEWHN